MLGCPCLPVLHLKLAQLGGQVHQRYSYHLRLPLGSRIYNIISALKKAAAVSVVKLRRRQETDEVAKRKLLLLQSCGASPFLTSSGYFFPRLRVFFSPTPGIFFTDSGYFFHRYRYRLRLRFRLQLQKKVGRLSTIKIFLKQHSFFLTRKNSFIYYYLFFKYGSLLSMWELTKRISLRISSVLSKVEPEPDLNTGYGSDQKVPASGPQH